MLKGTSEIINARSNKIEIEILSELETIYYSLQNECKLYNYNCKQCPHDKICDKVVELIVTINERFLEEKL